MSIINCYYPKTKFQSKKPWIASIPDINPTSKAVNSKTKKPCILTLAVINTIKAIATAKITNNNGPLLIKEPFLELIMFALDYNSLAIFIILPRFSAHFSNNSSAFAWASSNSIGLSNIENKTSIPPS